MPNERTFARYVSQGLKAYGHPQRHEDALSVGVADLSFASGGVTAWVELKALDAWPKRPDTLVHLRNFTYEQLNWLTARAKHTPNVFLMIKIEETKEYLLFHSYALPKLKEGMTQEMMRVASIFTNRGPVNFNLLADTLRLKP